MARSLPLGPHASLLPYHAPLPSLPLLRAAGPGARPDAGGEPGTRARLAVAAHPASSSGAAANLALYALPHAAAESTGASGVPAQCSPQLSCARVSRGGTRTQARRTHGSAPLAAMGQAQSAGMEDEAAPWGSPVQATLTPGVEAGGQVDSARLGPVQARSDPTQATLASDVLSESDLDSYEATCGECPPWGPPQQQQQQHWQQRQAQEPRQGQAHRHASSRSTQGLAPEGGGVAPGRSDPARAPHQMWVPVLQQEGQEHSQHTDAHAPASPSASASTPSLVVFSGGTAFNAITEELKTWTTSVAHVLPVSDDGGSTAEIVRVIGGPAIGDIRSRCLRLSDGSTAESRAVKRLLGHRLPLQAKLAKAEWLSIVEGEHELWSGLSEPYKDTIRAFLVHFQHQILRNASHRFCFQNGSVGNFFFAGARSFFRSLDAAIFLFSRVSHIPADSLVLPCVCTNDRLTLGAELQDGTIIRGQNEISHPGIKDSPCFMGGTLSPQPVNKAADASLPLPAPIRRVFYMSSDGTNLLHEVFPTANPRILERLRTVDAIVYGVGSLYTSICPSLVLRGVGEEIALRSCPKILLLNGAHDRETDGMTAADFVTAISHALNRTYGEDSVHRLRNNCGVYVTHLLVPEGGDVALDVPQLQQLGINHIRTVKSVMNPGSGHPGVLFDVPALVDAIQQVVPQATTAEHPGAQVRPSTWSDQGGSESYAPRLEVRTTARHAPKR